MEDIPTESLDFPESETWVMTAYKFVEKMVDIWDFIWVKWEVFKTHKWELTIFVSEFKFLSKAVRPLPEKFHGLSDQEDLYRKRYLDMTMNPESYARFLFKSKFYKTLREFYFTLLERGIDITINNYYFEKRNKNPDDNSKKLN